MSPDEMRDFCNSIQPYQLKVQVRLKNGREIFVGEVMSVAGDRFEMAVQDRGPMQVRYAWVSSMAHAAS